jgi:hypothetical protein
MDSWKRLRPLLRSIVLCFGTLIIAGLASCGSDSSANPVGVSVVSSVANGAAMLTNSSGTQTTVALIPTFSTTIHDYVIRCGAAPNISLSITLPGSMSLTLTEPDGTLVGPAIYPSGQFSQAMAISPGQRFQFGLSGQSDGYSVRCLPADFPSLTVSRVGNALPILLHNEAPFPMAQWYLFAPTLQAVTTPPTPPSYAIITDSNGTPVWWKSEPLGAVMDLKVLGSNQIGWSIFTGVGKFFIRDFTGTLLHTIAVAGSLDSHDVQLTPQGTYLGIQTVARVCPPDCADMSPWGGPASTSVVDAQILEIDGSNNIIWTWRTRDHIALSETGEEDWYPSVGTDIIHMNAVEPDGSDAVLFSSRHLNAIYRVIKSTGAIDWKIGGATRAESITVTGDTRPTALGPKGLVLNGQHDVRRWSDGTVSVHDNGTLADRPPYVVRYQIDTTSRTAEVVEEFTDSRATGSGCCGSARRLDDGHWLVDWGENGFMTEMVDGVPVLTVQYGTGTNPTFSYRATAVPTGMISPDTLRAGMDAMAAAL